MADDARGRLGEDPFEYRVTKDGRVLVARGGQQVAVVAGARGARLAARLEGAGERERQLLLAAVTGNYRRGNERRA
jgi:hypothetical protein